LESKSLSFNRPREAPRLFVELDLSKGFGSFLLVCVVILVILLDENALIKFIQGQKLSYCSRGIIIGRLGTASPGSAGRFSMSRYSPSGILLGT
jgi:hypothetical protein